MANDQLRAFLQKKKAQATAPNIDWAAKRDRFIQAVSRLYDTITNDFLGSTDTADLVHIDRSMTKTVEEQHIGKYDVPELSLAVGDEQVHFSPKGVNMVGATGRVDVRGEGGEVMLVQQSDDRWSIVLSRVPKLQLIPLTDTSFLAMLQRVMR